MENNLNTIDQDQPVTLPIQETPAQVQEIPPEETSTQFQEMPLEGTTSIETEKKPKGKKIIIIFLILLFLLSIAAVAYIFIIKPKSEKAEPVITDKNTPSTTSAVPQNDTVSTESPFGKLTNGDSENNSDCNNMECLIEAVKKCEPTTITIAYSNQSNSLLGAFGFSDEMVFSGKTVYEIKNPNEGNICSLYTSYPASKADFSEESKKELIALGSTEEQISELLKTVNDSMNLIEVRKSKTVCTGDRNTIAEFLIDLEKGNMSVETETSILESSKSIYTTSSGKKLECVTELPPRQKANTNTQITSEECEAKSGNIRFTEMSGGTCYVGETDLGKIFDKNLVINIAQQCCVSN